MATDIVMDETNWALLEELQRDARVSYRELSRRVNLSPPAVAERIRRMEEAGVLLGLPRPRRSVPARLDDPRPRAHVLPRQPVRAARPRRPGVAGDRRDRPCDRRFVLDPAGHHPLDGPLRIGDRPPGDVRPPVELDGALQRPPVEGPPRTAGRRRCCWARSRVTSGRLAGAREERRHVGLGPRSVDAEIGRHAAAGFEVEQGEEDVLGPDVVVAQPQASRTSARAPCGPAGCRGSARVRRRRRAATSGRPSGAPRRASCPGRRSPWRRSPPAR